LAAFDWQLSVIALWAKTEVAGSLEPWAQGKLCRCDEYL